MSDWSKPSANQNLSEKETVGRWRPEPSWSPLGMTGGKRRGDYARVSTKGVQIRAFQA